MSTETIGAQLFKKMINVGASNLKRYTDEINGLNVFPIPDGDTGDNMLLTILGGRSAEEDETLGAAARRAGDGMLLSARGNSGVILSQLFDGIAAGLDGVGEADIDQFGKAFCEGVAHAYKAVMEPTEGTILTVAREASEYASSKDSTCAEDFFDDFLNEANRSLKRTPELLPVLKKAGVVDSGGAGLIRIVEGMRQALYSEEIPEDAETASAGYGAKLDLDLFDENSVLEYGYCTELLLRLQNSKTNINEFDINTITDYLNAVGESVVAFKKGSIVKIHVHTMTPDLVLAFCRKYGEFLTVKIENMSLQHSSADALPEPEENKERKRFGIVTVACGEGICRMMRELGADVVVNGGQSMNPSAKDFIDAFDEINADTVFVLPNNKNIILTAKQAAKMYDKSDIRVIESRNIGEGHAALTMLNTESDNADEIEKELNEAMEGVVTAAVSTCSRDTLEDNFALYKGEYIGFVGDRVISADNDRLDTAKRLVDGLDFTDREICILLFGREADMNEAEAIKSYIESEYPSCEVYVTDGGQDIFYYMMIVE
ncbi:MAG: DAK2 domain-containing protein [Firmicutes bacterium]|nr:DAK2 domain-containing protein [Bacillota bacterium]